MFGSARHYAWMFPSKLSIISELPFWAGHLL